MSYGEIKIDTITFTAGGVDTSIAVSGLVQNPTFTGNITTTGTITADVVIGTTLVSGATVTGTTANFVTVSGTTALGNTARFITVSGTTVTGTQANFIGVSGTTITGAIGRFTNVTGVNIVGTTLVSGATVTGNIGSFTTLTGGTVNLTSGVFASGTAAAPSVSIGTTDNGLYSPGADQVAISTNGTGRLFINSSGQVGVGTSSPSQQLHVTSAGNTTALIAGGGTGYAQLKLTGGSTENYIDSDDPLQLSIGGTTRATLTSTGLGVGTTTPGATLEVKNAGSTEYAIFNTSSANGGYLSLKTNNVIYGYVGAADQIITGGASSNFGIRATNNLQFSIGASEKVRIDSSGLVGIGTSAPSTLFHANSTDATVYSTSSAQSENAALMISNGLNNNNNIAQITFRQRGVSTYDASIGASGGSSSFLFFKQGGAEKMRLTSTGLGVGTTSPQARLHIANETTPGQFGRILFDANVTSGYDTKIEATDVGLEFTAKSNSRGFAFSTGSTPLEKVRIDSSGRLLVGTSSSSTADTLVLANNSSSANDAAVLRMRRAGTIATGNNVGVISFENIDGLRIGASIQCENDQAANWATGDSPGRLVFSTTADGASSPTERLRIDSSGRVGIGSSTPNCQLTNTGTTSLGTNNWPTSTVGRSGGRALVGAGGTLISWNETAGAGNAAELYLGTATGAGATTMGYARLKGGTENGTNSASFFSIETSNTAGTPSTALYIDSSNRVGIGTTSPLQPLHVKNAGSTACRLVLENSGSTAAGSTQIYSQNNDLVFDANSSERARIDSSGRLLVGTSTSVSVAGLESNQQIFGSAPQLSVVRGSNNASGPLIALAKSRNTAYGSRTIVPDGDFLGTIRFCGDDGADLDSIGAQIAAQVDGTPGANDMPGRLVFSTTADGASSPTERLRIDSSGRVGIGTTNGTAGLSVLTYGTQLGAGANTYMTPSGRHHVQFGNVANGTDVYAGFTSDYATTSGSCNIVLQPTFNNTSQQAGAYVAGEATGLAATAITFGHFNGGATTGSNATKQERARIDSSGRLLVGTSSTAQVSTAIFQGNSGGASNAALVYLNVGTSSPADGAVLGGLRFSDTSHVPCADVVAYRDGGTWATGSSMPSRLVFSTTADGASSPVARLTIKNDGSVIWGDVYGDTVGATNRDLYIDSTGLMGYVSSIRASKANINSIESPDWLYQLNPVSFNRRRKDDTDNYTDETYEELEYGLIAEEVEKVAPELCFYDVVDSVPELRGVHYTQLITPMLKALQQANQRIETLEAKVAALESA